MSLQSRRPPSKDPSPALAVLGLIVAALVTIFQTPGVPTYSDAVFGLLFLLIAQSYRFAIPVGLAPQLAFALVRGGAAWLLLAGLIYGLRDEPLLNSHLAPVYDFVAGHIPERLWFPVGWLALTGLALPFRTRGA